MSTQSYADKSSGWTGFAAVVMFAVGFFRIISAITYFANSTKINDLSHGLFGGQTWLWGLWDLLIAAAAIMAGRSLLSGGVYGKAIGYIWGTFVIVQSFVIIGFAPWYAALSITLAALVIYGLGVTPEETPR